MRIDVTLCQPFPLTYVKNRRRHPMYAFNWTDDLQNINFHTILQALRIWMIKHICKQQNVWITLLIHIDTWFTIEIVSKLRKIVYVYRIWPKQLTHIFPSFSKNDILPFLLLSNMWIKVFTMYYIKYIKTQKFSLKVFSVVSTWELLLWLKNLSYKHTAVCVVDVFKL